MFIAMMALFIIIIKKKEERVVFSFSACLIRSIIGHVLYLFYFLKISWKIDEICGCYNEVLIHHAAFFFLLFNAVTIEEGYLHYDYYV